MTRKEALRRERGGRFDYTETNRGTTGAIGYCAGTFERIWPEAVAVDLAHAFGGQDGYRQARERAKAFAEKYHDDGHATEAEACACYRTYLLDQTLQVMPDRTVKPGEPRYQCEATGCTEATTGGVVVDSYWVAHLCVFHRTRVDVEPLYPAVLRSWSA